MDKIVHKKNKIYYTMGEVAEMFDVNPSLIRFWEQKFDIIKPHKNKKGNRLFTPEDVDNLRLIYHLVKDRGMTLAGANKLLKTNRKDVEANMEVIEKLQSIKSILAEIKQQLGSDENVVSQPALDYDETEEEPQPALSVESRANELEMEFINDELHKTDEGLFAVEEEEWLEDEIEDTQQLQQDIEVLTEKACVTPEEAEQLLDTENKLPLESPLEQQQKPLIYEQKLF